MPIVPSPAVVRACEVLRLLSRHATTPFSVSDLARELDVPRATCDAILQGLAESGFVSRRADDLRYELGPSCIPLGDAARAANSVLRAAAGEARELARALGACAAVSMRDGDESRVAEVFDFGPPFGSNARVGQSIPHAPPFGAVYVAWDPHDAGEWIARGGTALRGEERRRYHRALDEVRRRGYSVTIASPRRPELAAALATLATTPDAEAARRTRDELIVEFMHSEYLPIPSCSMSGKTYRFPFCIANQQNLVGMKILAHPGLPEVTTQYIRKRRHDGCAVVAVESLSFSYFVAQEL